MESNNIQQGTKPVTSEPNQETRKRHADSREDFEYTGSAKKKVNAAPNWERDGQRNGDEGTSQSTIPTKPGCSVRQKKKRASEKTAVEAGYQGT